MIKLKNNNEFLNSVLKTQYSEKEIERIYEGYNSKRRVTLRVNTIKSNIEEIKSNKGKAGNLVPHDDDHNDRGKQYIEIVMNNAPKACNIFISVSKSIDLQI